MCDWVEAEQANAHERYGEGEMFRRFVNLLADILIASENARAAVKHDEPTKAAMSSASSPDASSAEESE